jgi:hypothetical protein
LGLPGQTINITGWFAAGEADRWGREMSAGL